MATTLLAVTDVHAGSDAVGFASQRKLTRLAPQLLDDVITSCESRRDLQAVINLGDLIEHAGHASTIKERIRIDQENFAAQFRKFDALKIPSLHCIGNHPLMSLTEQMLSSLTGLKEPYYARDIGEHRVVMLHSRFRQLHDSPSAKSGSGIYLDDPQLKWLKSELNRTDRNVLVCCHHPLSDQDLIGNIWFERFPQCALTENRDEVQQLLAESGKVIAVLSGHTHWNYLTRDQYGTPHLTLQSLSENFRNDGTPAATHGVVTLKGASFNVELFGNDLSLRGSGNNPEQIAKDLGQCYDSIADEYDSKTFQFGEAELKQYERLFELLRPNHTTRVIDFGCGPGRDVHYWEKRGFDYVGIDVAEKFLEIARKRSPEQTYIRGNFSHVPLKKDSAALAIFNSSLQHVPRESLDETLRNAFNALEPNGVLYCHYRSGSGQSLSISTEYGVPISRFIALYTDQEMEAALRRVGFDVLRSETFDHKYEGLKGKVVQYKTRTYARKPEG